MVDAIPAGNEILAEDLLPWSDQINSLTAPGWTAYTPTWTNTTTNPAIGNGSWAGSRYRRPAGADLVDFDICLTAGSTTTFGTGSFWQFGFPFTPNDVNAHGVAWLEDVSAGARRFFHWFNFSNSIIVTNEAGTLVNAAAPWTWATGDTLRVTGRFQPA